MTIRLNPYLTFRGQARDALDFYQDVLGGTLEVMTYSDMGGPEEMGVSADRGDWVMHGSLDVSGAVFLTASDDARPEGEEIANGQIALSGSDAGEEPRMREVFARLGEGGEVHVPFEKAPWGDWFGQAKDRFGVTWMVNVSAGDGAGAA